MKRVTGIVWMMMLVTLLFCACGHEEPVSCAAEPTGAPVHTVTEPLHGSDRQMLEQLFDVSGRLVEDRISEYDEEGNLTTFSVTVYDAAGAVQTYSKKTYWGGILSSSLVKHYSGGSLSQQIDVFYYENQDPKSVRKQIFSDSGAIIEASYRAYFEDGAPAAKETSRLDPQTGFQIVSKESFHESGHLKTLHNGIHHAVSGALLDGKIESFDENGNLTECESANWDGQTRTAYRESSTYDATGTVISSLQESRYYDSFGNEIASNVTVYEQDRSFVDHRIENRSFNDAGRPTGIEIRHYREDGTPAEYYQYRCEYDAAGNLICDEKLHYLSPGIFQNHTVTEYTYGEERNVVRVTQTGFDKDDAQIFQTVKEFDCYGKVTTFVTVSNLGNRYTYAYTYDGEGRVATELLTTEYRSGRRIDYQETAWEYHENGNPKRISVHQWTSYDEAKYPDANLGDLGKTTVTEYDEDGNKM